MFSLKKIITTGLSAILLAFTTLPTISMAVQQYNDPDGSGSILLNDAIVIDSYLANGGNYTTNLERLDFDNNCIVSAADSFMIQLYRLALLVTGTINLPVSETYNGANYVTYHVFDSQTGTHLSSNDYSISANSTVANSFGGSVSTHTIIGETDDRVENWDRSGVVKIMQPNGYIGTGFVVAPHVIATAAHCVYNYYNTNSEAGKIISGIKVFNELGVNVLTATPVESHVPTNYIMQSKLHRYTNEYDYALITVEEDLSDYMCFNLGVALDKASDYGISIVNAGFPATINPDTSLAQTVNSSTMHLLYQCTGSLMNVVSEYSDRLLSYSADTSGGNSGGPVYVAEYVRDKNGNNAQVYYTVIAINVGSAEEYNFGTRMNGELIRFYKHNLNLHW